MSYTRAHRLGPKRLSGLCLRPISSRARWCATAIPERASCRQTITRPPAAGKAADSDNRCILASAAVTAASDPAAPSANDGPDAALWTHVGRVAFTARRARHAAYALRRRRARRGCIVKAEQSRHGSLGEDDPLLQQHTSPHDAPRRQKEPRPRSASVHAMHTPKWRRPLLRNHRICWGRNARPRTPPPSPSPSTKLPQSAGRHGTTSSHNTRSSSRSWHRLHSHAPAGYTPTRTANPFRDRRCACSHAVASLRSQRHLPTQLATRIRVGVQIHIDGTGPH